MTEGLQAAAILVVALFGLAAAILAGVDGGEAKIAASALPPPACCLYLIF